MIVKIANDEGLFIKQDIDDFKYNSEANEVEITFNVEHHNEAGEFIAFKVKTQIFKNVKKFNVYPSGYISEPIHRSSSSAF